jgi:hypothetical protein
MTRPGGSSSFGIEIAAGGSNRVPVGCTVHAGGMKMVPLGGGMGSLSSCTWLRETMPSREPSRNVTEFAKTVIDIPGTPGISMVTSSSPPTMAPWLSSGGTRIGPIGSSFNCPATVTASKLMIGKVSDRGDVVAST